MADMSENPQTENDENVVYEYVELEEGQELPEGYEYEYEYVEVPEGGAEEVSELDVVSQKAEEVPAEEAELASAAEIEAVLSPRNLEEEIEGTSIPVPVSVSAAVPEPVSVPVAEEPKMPQIGAPGSEMDLDKLLDDVQEPKFEMPQLENIAEDDNMPKFEIAAPEPEAEKEAGIPSLDSLLDMAEPEIAAAPNAEAEPVEEDVAAVNEESAFVEPDNIKFQNSDEDDEKKDWFDESHLKSGAEIGSVDIDAIVKEAPAESVATAEEDILVPQSVPDKAESADEVLNGETAALENLLSEMKAEIGATEKVSEPTVISEESLVPEEADEAVVSPLVQEDEPLIESRPVVEVLPEEPAVSESDPVVIEDGLDISLDDLLEDTPVSAVDDLVDIESAAEQKTVAEDAIPVLSEPEEPGIPEIGGLLAAEEAVLPEVSRTEPEAFIAEEETAVETVVIPVDEKTEEVVAGMAKETEAISAAAANFEPVSAGLIDSSKEAEEIVNPQVVFPVAKDCSAEQFSQKAISARLVSKNDGIQSFKGTESVNVLALNDVNFEENELNAWNLILFKQEILPLTAKVSELDMPRNPQVNRFAGLVKAGEQKAEFFNEDKLKIINTTDSCVAVQGRFVCGDLQTNSGLIINDMLTIPLRDFAGKELSFDKPASGLLCGPDGALLYFFNVRGVLVPNAENAKIDAEKLQYKISKWYSGSLNDKYFEFNAQSPSGSFEGNDEIKAIHVNVNNSSYGWNVTFDNGLSMNLRDLREYQTRFGKMPSPNGVISYGQTKLTFSNVERIVVYESAQYYFYS